MIQEFRLRIFIWRKWKHLNLVRYMHSMFLAGLFTIVNTWKQPKCPSMDGWINEMHYTHTEKYYSDMKRKSCHFCENMDIILSEKSIYIYWKPYSVFCLFTFLLMSFDKTMFLNLLRYSLSFFVVVIGCLYFSYHI